MRSVLRMIGEQAMYGFVLVAAFVIVAYFDITDRIFPPKPIPH